MNVLPGKYIEDIMIVPDYDNLSVFFIGNLLVAHMFLLCCMHL